MYRHGDSERGKADWVIKNSMESLQGNGGDINDAALAAMQSAMQGLI